MSSEDWMEADVEDDPHLLALVAEHVLGLHKVGLIKDTVWYTDLNMGVFKFTLNWDTVKDIMSITHISIEYDDKAFWAWYLQDGKQWAETDDDADVALCVAALRSIGWKGRYQ